MRLKEEHSKRCFCVCICLCHNVEMLHDVRMTLGPPACALVLQGTARIFLLTKKSVVLADQKTGQVKASVPLPDLTSVSVSTQSDGFFALKLKEVRETCRDV